MVSLLEVTRAALESHSVFLAITKFATFPDSRSEGKTRRKSPTMRNRAFGPIATLLSLVLVTTTTVQAGPISVSEVVQVVGRYQSTGRGPELRLRSVSGGNSLVDESVGKPATGSVVAAGPLSAGEVLDTST